MSLERGTGQAMKLLYLAFDPVPFPKGSGRRIEATVRALGRSGCTVTLVTPRPQRTPPGFAQSLEGLEHRTVPMPDGNFLERALAFREQARRHVAERAWDVVMYRSPWEGLPALESRARTVYEAHGFPSVELPSHYPRVLEKPALKARLVHQENLLLARSDLLVTPSQTGRLYLQSRGVSPGRIFTLPNSVDLTEFPDPGPEPDDGPPFRLCYLGTLAPWQGVTLLLESLARLKRAVPLELHVAGTRKGRWMALVRGQARRLGVRSLVRFHGPLDRAGTVRLMRTSHLCVAPLPDDPRNSLQGCCPIKLLEYMAAGRPVLSTAIAPVLEIVEHGETGWLVRPNSPFALARGIETLLEDAALRGRLARRAREEVASRFSRKGFDEQIAQLVEAVAR